MEINFTGKKALVTGAGRGIGKQIAQQLAHCGAHVYALGRTQSHLDTLKTQYNGTGQIETMCVDLENLEESRSMVEALGPLDLLVNNAGLCKHEPFEEIKMEEYDHMMTVNVRAVINITQGVVKGMKAKGQGGAIVNISSCASMRGLANASGYSSTKSALDKLTQIMAIELGAYQIRVNGVHPQLVETDMAKLLLDSRPDFLQGRCTETPLGRICKVEDVSNVVLFLLSDKAAMVTGIQLPIDGGLLAGRPAVK